jgi:transposase
MHPSLTTERIEQMCADAGVKLVYLPPYSTDLNPIEEFFGELKTFIKRNWHTYEDNLRQGFDVSGMVSWCCGREKRSAKDHFRHAEFDC